MMDSNKIGMVDQEKFNFIISIETAITIPKEGSSIADGFEWQEEVIQMIKDWALKNKLGPIEAFKSFDRDLSGAITKESMRKSLVEYLQMNYSAITNTRLDRLFKMVSFYKQATI